jgi:insulysin
MQYLDEPTFNQLRTIEQLGYVVFARKSDYRDVMGTQFIIQSPKYSSEYIVNSLNTFLASQREKVKTLTNEEFKTQVEAVLTKVAEKDYNLQGEHGRFWSEISCHKYLFDRQQKEVQALKELTLDQFKAHFERVFFSETHSKRLDFELNSATHKEGQAEWKAKNAEKYGKRTEVALDGSLQTFKKMMGLHPDLFKANFASFKM